MTTPPPAAAGGSPEEGAPASEPRRPAEDEWLRAPVAPTSLPRIGGSPVEPPSAAAKPAPPTAAETWRDLPTYPPLDAPHEPPPAAGRTINRKANRGLVLVAGAVVVLGASFAIANLGSEGGAPSPEAAVDDLLHAVSGEDVIGALERVRPAERAALKGPLEDSVAELERLDLLADVDLGHLQGVDVEISGYQLRTTELTPGVVAVTVSGGTVSGASTPSDLPIGETMRTILEEDLGVDLADNASRTTDELGEFQLVAVEEDGGWYVSPGYSIAEWARQESGAPLPPFGRVTPVGGDNPEAAVRALADAAVELDAQRAITALDPEEMAALYDYAPLFLDDAAQAANEARDTTAVTLDLTDLRAEDGPDGTWKVFVDGFDLAVASHDEYGDDRFSLTYDGDCFRYEETWTYAETRPSHYGDDEVFGPNPESDSAEWCRGQELVTHDEHGDGTQLPPLDAAFDQLAFVTVERDGRWYVAPGRSVLELAPAFLRGVEGGDVEAMREWLREIVGPLGPEEFDDVGSIVEGGPDFDPVAPPVELPPEPDPIEKCNDLLGTVDYDQDPVHAGAPVERLTYLFQQRVNECIANLVASKEMPDGAEPTFQGSACWEPYDALGPDATAEQWEAADRDVAACYADDAYGGDS
jgi:hypothetical protein